MKKICEKPLQLTLALKIGVLFAVLDLVAWLLLGAIGSGQFIEIFAITSEGQFSQVLSDFWGKVHLPVDSLFLPYLLPLMPSHGGGQKAVFAEATYVALCMVQVFIIGFMIGFLVKKKPGYSQNSEDN